MDKKQNQFSTTARGTAAEDRALLFLESLGYTLFQKNYRIKGGEIDLIVLDLSARALVFVEVRSAHSKSPWLRSSISRGKCQRLWRAMRSFDQWQGARFSGYARRFDMIWIESQKVEHWKNVGIL